MGWLLLTASAVFLHSQTLPATPPTSAPNQQSQGTPGAAIVSPNPANHAEVTYANGLLLVRADNSSLNQILRSICHQTGLKVTGGVADQRVFGSYGPAPMSTVLATLLDGTGTNILLLGGDAKTPPELVLTPLHGGVEPPGPNSSVYAMYDDATDHQPMVAPTHPGTAQSQPISASPALPSPQPVNRQTNPAATTPAATAAGKTLTPEMVMQQLLQMQKQQNQRKQEIQKGQSQKSGTRPKPTSPGSQAPQ
ncbi:MAG: hypothetical protein WBY53_01900 [Acidobacteriaceae bacterium]